MNSYEKLSENFNHNKSEIIKLVGVKNNDEKVLKRNDRFRRNLSDIEKLLINGELTYNDIKY
jgi:hypothetical protein